jgi:hypothetical protein
MFIAHYVKDCRPQTKSFTTATAAREFVEEVVKMPEDAQNEYYITGVTLGDYFGAVGEYFGAEMDYVEQKIITKLRFAEKRGL